MLQAKPRVFSFIVKLEMSKLFIICTSVYIIVFKRFHYNYFILFQFKKFFIRMFLTNFIYIFHYVVIIITVTYNMYHKLTYKLLQYYFNS